MMQYYEDRRVVVRPTKDDLTEKLTLRGRRRTCSSRVVLCYDPDYVPVTRVWVTDPNPLHGAQWLKKLPNSISPGIYPSRWFNVSHAERRKAVEQFRLEKRSFFGIEDPGPCIALFRDIGIDPATFQEEAQGLEEPRLSDSTLHPGADIRQQKKGETIVPEGTEVDWHALLHPAGPAEE
eukprot:3385456-Pyramimonas_sp.AAC.1